MRRFIFNLVSVLFSAVKFGIMKLFHFHHFFYSGIQRFSPNTEVVIAEGGTIRLGRHVRVHRRSKLLAMDGGTLEIGSNTALGNGVSVNCMESIVIGEGVQIGGGAKILGNTHVGDHSRIAAGSVVLEDVPRLTTVAGVPARVVGEAGCPEPALTMDHLLKPM